MATPKSGKTAPIKIDERQIETLAGIGCTLEDLALVFNCNESTITRNYAEYLKRGRANGRVSVRRMMWEQGKKGNSVALKYLVHNILREKIEFYNYISTDKITFNVNDPVPVMEAIASDPFLSPEHRRALAQKLIDMDNADRQEKPSATNPSKNPA